MTTTKKAASRKAASKGGSKGKDGRTRSQSPADFWRLRANGEAGHSPIIITDGSASIEFARTEYDDEGNGHHTSIGLFLREIIANQPHPMTSGDPPGSHICHSFTGLARFRLEVTVRVGDVDEIFTIIGHRFGLTSPTIDFNTGRFEVDAVNFPPKYPNTGVRFGNLDGNITRLRIFRGNAPQPVHDCPLASGNGVQYTISDPHIFV